MSSGFLGFNIASNGLFSARTAFDVTAHNITNANTKGYSRQIIEQRATQTSSDQYGKGMLGTAQKYME